VQSADTSGRHTIQVEMSMDDAILSPTEEVSGQKITRRKRGKNLAKSLPSSPRDSSEDEPSMAFPSDLRRLVGITFRVQENLDTQTKRVDALEIRMQENLDTQNARAAALEMLVEKQKEELSRLTELINASRASTTAVFPDALTRKASALKRRESIGFGMEEPSTVASEDHLQLWRTSMSECPLSETMWEAPLLVGAVAMGRGGQAWMLLLVLLNIFLQAYFIGIIWTNLIVVPMSEAQVAHYANWRLYIAHDSAQMAVGNDGEHISLARQVCENQERLILARGQAEVHDLLYRYLGGAWRCGAVCPRHPPLPRCPVCLVYDQRSGAHR